MPAFDLSSLTFFDYIIFVILGLSAVFSMLRGMTREFLGLAGWVISVFIALSVAPFFKDWLSNFLKVEGLTDILAWSLPFAGCVVGWFILASLISPGLKQAGLGALDKWLGVLFGLLRGLLFVMLVYAGCVLYAGAESKLYDQIKYSQSAPYVSAMIGSVQNSSVLPAALNDFLQAIRLDSNRDEIPKGIEKGISELKDNAQNSLNLLSDEK